MAKYQVILVAGHALGGDPGAVGQGTTESVETVQIVDRIFDLLLPHPGIIVTKVPHELDYVDSTTWINQRFAWDNSDTIVVEIHLNAPAVASGAETLIGGSYPETQRMGASIQNALIASTKLPNRGVKIRNDLYLMNSVNPLACLVEVRFIGVDDNSDAADAKAAHGIANGIADFFRQPRPLSTPTPIVVNPSPIPYVDALYHVMLGGKQVGAYKIDKNAYIKWEQTPGSIVLDGTGKDVTGELVKKYAPPVAVPEPITPVVDYSKENNALLKELLGRVKDLSTVAKDVLAKLLSVFK